MNEQQTVQKLKSERVQGPARKKRLPRPDDLGLASPAPTQIQIQRRLKSERVQSRLKRLPEWRMQSGGKAIDRMRKFPDALVAASYLAYAALLARQMGQRLWVAMNGTTLSLVLPGRFRRPGEGITEEVLDLAEQLG
ncbi:MAG TPA: hypothetical protein VKM72_33395 [Thermoanaerobaculia bacterium]|nr:hypothetical protein [Thermoanaerobaculia bacterium]